MAVWANDLQVLFLVVGAVTINMIEFKWAASTLWIDLIPSTLRAFVASFFEEVFSDALWRRPVFIRSWRRSSQEVLNHNFVLLFNACPFAFV